MPCRPVFLFRSALVLLLVVAGVPADAADGHWMAQANGVAKAVDEAEASFAKGDVAGGKRALTEAYFHNFEDTKLEAAIRKYVSAKRATEIERSFAAMRKAMTANDAAGVKSAGQSIREAVTAEAKGLDAAKVAPGVFEVNQ
ncbi:MAG: hypothetical protein H7Y60_06705 [Rhodospirillaceae bacterium]|nr:hypothetical protein [Rhodospirillales bacterium]